ncbi:oxidoreductase [Metarhizium guizhouense ARSEF 977]|uniref:Oxidoreductase n=1 Tax=Metarhizium guizhouense (strain ARSEF 977) TaxID=1276136 RepID=A0A0B4GKP9_METGA|nr:oxidoreductase [Metarhizium guizhouense ARSEF 977]
MPLPTLGTVLAECGSMGHLQQVDRGKPGQDSTRGLSTLQDWVWEGNGLVEEICHVVTSPEESQQSACHQGRVPLYSVTVQSTTQIQSAVRFAKKHNLRLVVKNSGHDCAGRSSSPDSFQIHTNLLKGITYHDNFVAQGSAAKGSGPAVTMGAGIMHWEVYSDGAKNGYTIVGGECPTVGAVGGFLQGGGVSSFHSFTKGLAVDNVLEYQVVTANGELIAANENQNRDLFWALKGGGGGTFGVVAQATVRVYPDDPITVAAISISTSLTNSLFWTEGVSELLRLLKIFNQQGFPGQIVVMGPNQGSVQATLEFHFPNTTDESYVNGLLNSQMRPLGNHKISTKASIRVQKKASSEVRLGPDIYPPQYGIVQGSVLISAALFNSADGPPLIARNFSNLSLGPNDILFTSNLGGRVMDNSDIDIPLHPSWRSAAQLVTLVRAVEPSNKGKLAALETLHSHDMPILYSLEPKYKVSYRNLGDPSEKEFQSRYWGSNYKRLASIKARWDPDELFITRLGVGSEEWDTEGMCRKSIGLVARVGELLRLSGRWILGGFSPLIQQIDIIDSS